MKVHTAGTLTVHYTCLISPTSINYLCISLRLNNKAELGKVLMNEVEADKLFSVFEVFRFDSQVGFL